MQKDLQCIPHALHDSGTVEEAVVETKDDVKTEEDMMDRVERLGYHNLEKGKTAHVHAMSVCRLVGSQGPIDTPAWPNFDDPDTNFQPFSCLVS